MQGRIQVLSQGLRTICLQILSVTKNIYGNIYTDYWVDESLNPVPTSQGIGGEGYSHFYFL